MVTCTKHHIVEVVNGSLQTDLPQEVEADPKVKINVQFLCSLVPRPCNPSVCRSIVSNKLLKGLGMRLKGLGMRLKGLGMRLKGLGMRLKGLGMRLKGLGMRLKGLGMRLQGLGMGL